VPNALLFDMTLAAMQPSTQVPRKPDKLPAHREARTSLGERAQRLHDKWHQARARQHERMALLRARQPERLALLRGCHELPDVALHVHRAGRALIPATLGGRAQLLL